MSRVAIAISCTTKDRKELERLSKSRTDEARLVERARIVLAGLDGKRNDETAVERGCSPWNGAPMAGAICRSGIGGSARPQALWQAAEVSGD